MSKHWQAYAQHVLDAVKQISDFRNILVHDYLGDIDSQTVLEVLQNHLQPLESAVRTMPADSRDET